MKYTEEEKILILGSLFHDIGKFVQRCSSQWFQNHQLEGSKLVNDNDIKIKLTEVLDGENNFERFVSIIEKHHNKNLNDTLIKIVQEADRISASERVDKELDEDNNINWGNHFLTSLLTKIRLNSNEGYNKGLYKHELLINKNYNAIIPKEISQEDALKLGFKYNNETLINFCKDLNTILNFYDKEDENSFDTLVNNIIIVFEKYLWCIPDFTGNSETDISLYNHLKDVAGIALSLYRLKTGKNKNDLALIVGDIPGIQNYIFDVRNKKAAKLLRGRSIYVQVLTRAIVSKFLNELNLPESNVVMLAGGKFYILTNNSEKLIESCDKLKFEIEKYLLENLNFLLQFSYGICTFNSEEYKNKKITFGKIVEKANFDLLSRREQSLKNYIFNPDIADKLINHEPVITADSEENSLCSLTGKPIVKGRESTIEDPDENGNLENLQVDEQSKKEYNIGDNIVDNNNVILLDKDFMPDKVINFNDLTEDYKETSKILLNPDLEKLIDDKDKSKWGLNNSRYLEVANACSKKGKSVLDFETMTKMNTGAEFLTLIKGDIDNLGLIMAYGLNRDNETNLEALSRTTTLSNHLKYYFSTFINGLFNDNEFITQKVIKEKNEKGDEYYIKTENVVYTVFAGGDDLMLICPQSFSLKLLDKFNTSFNAFTCENPEIHISYSITHFKHNTPIRMVAELSEANQDKAKKFGKPSLDLSSPEYFYPDNNKNCLFIFDSTIKMQNLDSLIDYTEKLKTWNESNKISMGVIRNLLILSDYINKYRETGKTKFLMWHPMLSYMIRRNVFKKGEYPNSEIQEFFEKYLSLIKSKEEITNFEKLIYPSLCGAIYKLRRTK